MLEKSQELKSFQKTSPKLKDSFLKEWDKIEKKVEKI